MPDVLHTVFVRGRALRFLPAPITSDLPDGPWVDVHQLMAVLPVPSAFGLYFADIFARDWHDMVQQGTGPDGAPVVLAPWVAASAAALGLLSQLEKDGHLPRAAVDRLWATLCEGGAKACTALEQADPDRYPQGAADAGVLRWAPQLLRLHNPGDGRPH
jgi:hypothetical protein